jgi:hypothetical protein
VPSQWQGSLHTHAMPCQMPRTHTDATSHNARLGQRLKQGLHVACDTHTQALRRRLGSTQGVIQAALDAGVVQLGGRLVCVRGG